MILAKILLPFTKTQNYRFYRSKPHDLLQYYYDWTSLYKTLQNTQNWFLIK